MTSKTITKHDRRSMLGMVGGLASAAIATSAVASASTEGQSDIERLVREWWETNSRGMKVYEDAAATGASCDELDDICEAQLDAREAVENHVMQVPITTFAEACMVASIRFYYERGNGDLCNYVGDAFTRLGYRADF